MFNQKLFSLLQVIAQALFSFVFLSSLIKSGNKIDYVDWSLSISIVSAIYSFNIFSGVLFNKFIASGKYNTSIIFLNLFGIIVISMLTLIYGIYSSSKVYFYLAILFSSIMQTCFSLCNIVDGLGKITYRCVAQIIIFISFSLILFIAQKSNASMVQIIYFAVLCYSSIAIAGIFIITINKSWDLKFPNNNWSILISQNSYAIGGSVAQSWIEPLIKYNLIALGGAHLIALFDVSTRIASTIRTLIVSLNTPLITIWSKKYSQSVFNKELITNVILGTILNIIYISTSSMIFLVFFGIEEKNILFTSIIIFTYFLITLQNLPNISNIALNKLNKNFYATLIVLISVGLGYFLVSNAESYIWTYLIGCSLSTVYLFYIPK
ncbi:hypothetical protein PQZ43_02995 [Alphaproteobacteria bacterium]|nr:hypothetical protein [Alphaproteobacteria bacterium]